MLFENNMQLFLYIFLKKISHKKLFIQVLGLIVDFGYGFGQT